MKLKYILLILTLLILGSVGAYWYYFMSGSVVPTGEDTTIPSTGFVPFDRTNPSNVPTNTTPGETPGTNVPTGNTATGPEAKPPKLRMLSNTPVGGYGASTTLPNAKLAIPGTTVIRWIDRGRGNVYEAKGNTLSTETISNTVVPGIIESAWNTNLTSFVAALLTGDQTEVDLAYGQLRAQASTSSAPYSLRGSAVHSNIISFALSPRKDRVFTLVREENTAVGYISNIDGQKKVELFTTPLTQLTAEWPEENTITLTTNASANQNGFLYFVNPKTGTWKKVAGPLRGLTATVSHDAKYALLSFSKSGGTSLESTILTVGKGTQIDANFNTIAAKCAWGNFYKEMLYCGVPSQLPNGIYPNDWHIGTVSFNDQIWQINATSGDLKLASSIIDQSDRLIDAYHMGLDRNDNYLFFINKNDLSLWSLDLVAQ